MPHFRTLSLLALLTGPLIAGCNSTYTPSHWREQVPAAQRAQHATLPGTPANVQAGQDAYTLYCARCHADDALGTHGRPGLRSARVHGETDGEIFWILRNGTHHGMPDWRGLGDTTLWQLVQYIRSLPPYPAK